MPDIIHLLPDNIANQIAAGEVIQRPASAVKELLENAVDAGATEIRLLVSDAGKALIQVIDNGKGMSAADARLAFERHATSKIARIEDLFSIRTMGFRGEALASVAAVAQVELKSRRQEDETGTYVEMENSAVVRQEPVACPVGTSIAMKNVFFNVPARRNFLKSNAVEMRHIVEEFIRVSMAFPELFFSLASNGQEIFHLEKGTLKQRIVQILGNQYSARLVTVQEKTDYLNIYGFVGKPETAKKTRGDQYFFVNNRYIRSAYLSHAVMNAYQDIIATDSFPAYVLFIDLDPAQIDINVHPTKQEIKFEDEKIVYAFIQAAVKHALAQFSVTPTLEFDLDPNIQRLDAISQPFTPEKQSAALGSELYKDFSRKHQAHFIQPAAKSNLKNWQEFYGPAPQQAGPTGFSSLLDQVRGPGQDPAPGGLLPGLEQARLLQLQQTYILVTSPGGFLLLQQQRAHERVLYDQFHTALQGKEMATQRSLFPVTLQFGQADALLLQELLAELRPLGYLIEPFGKDAFVVQGTPADLMAGNEQAVIEKLLEQYKHFSNELKFSKREKLVRALAYQQSIKPGTALGETEMRHLLEQLFASTQPHSTPGGKPVFIEFNADYLEKRFAGG